MPRDHASHGDDPNRDHEAVIDHEASDPPLSPSLSPSSAAAAAAASSSLNPGTALLLGSSVLVVAAGTTFVVHLKTTSKSLLEEGVSLAARRRAVPLAGKALAMSTLAMGGLGSMLLFGWMTLGGGRWHDAANISAWDEAVAFAEEQRVRNLVCSFGFDRTSGRTTRSFVVTTMRLRPFSFKPVHLNTLLYSSNSMFMYLCNSPIYHTNQSIDSWNRLCHLYHTSL